MNIAAPKLLLIYTVGKVSSASIYHVCQQESSFRTYHAHYITPEKIKAQTELAGNAESMDADLIAAIEFVQEMSSYKGQLKIINIVREPIARTLSLFFANGNVKKEDVMESSNNSMHWDRAIDKFLKYDRHEELEYWIKSEFMGYTGIDLLKSNYSKKYGWGRHTTKRFDVLTFQYELGTDRKVLLLNNFLGTRIRDIPWGNTTSEKAGEEVGKIYREFLKQVALPVEYVNAMYDLETVRFFYTDDQLNSFRARWLKCAPSLVG